MKTSRLVIYLCIFLISILSANAQKKQLDHSVYDSWKSIGDIKLTNDGKYAIGIIKEQEGDSQLSIKDLVRNSEVSIDRAYRYNIVPNQKYVVALIKAPYSKIREAKIKKTADEKMPKDSLAIIRLDNFSIQKIANVKNYRLGKDHSDFIAYAIDDSIKNKDKTKAKAYTLVLRNIQSAKEDTLKSVTEYLFSKNGNNFTAIIQPDKKDTINKRSVIVSDLKLNVKKVISTGQTIYKNITISESGDKVAFLGTADSLKQEIKNFELFFYQNKKDSAISIANKQTAGMPEKWSVSENFTPTFSKNEKRLLLGTAPIQLPKDTTIPDFEKAKLDLWHWQEPLIQPMQLVQRDKKLKQSYLAYINLDNNNFHQLANEDMPEVTIPDENNGSYAVGLSNLKYQFEIQWDVAARNTNDVWLIDLSNQSKKQIKTKLQALHSYSPNGEYLAWYDLIDRQYYCYSFRENKEICLTKSLNINFWDEKNDTPAIPYPYGFAAWTENDNALLVYDAYDIWKLDPKGIKLPENLTKETGRNNKLTLRYVKTDEDSRFISDKEVLLLSAFDNTTKENGFYQLSAKGIKSLIIDKFTYNLVAKAKDKDIYSFVKSNFNTSPDLYTTANLWKTELKLTDINPQMREYNWGSAELVSWTTFDGKPTQGIVYKPENFDPNKKYPVMIYFYEKHSDNLYQYFAPAPSRSIINIPFFCSREYIVFSPDIQYTTGRPGQSAYNSIVSGAEMLAKNSWVDKENMAIQGQSWGGYQVAYLVTKTNMFKAAGSGAPVSNMFSAYGGIRWESGMSRQYQYEQTQSRIGATMWEAPELYKENSPIFFADKVNTPLLIMHNDNDGAVPWYQGIEYFMALRRLAKPVWMLQYNNEAHNLKERKNCKDLSIRLQQFFDHYLKGAPAPIWLTKGIPATEKGITYGLETE